MFANFAYALAQSKSLEQFCQFFFDLRYANPAGHDFAIGTYEQCGRYGCDAINLAGHTIPTLKVGEVMPW